MDEYKEPENLPLGLVMQLGMDREAMNAFAALSDTEKERIVDFIKSGATGGEVKERITQVMNTLDHHQSMF